MDNCTRRLFDLVPKEHTGTPSFYVAHAWGALFLALLEQILHHLTPPGVFQIHALLGLWQNVFFVNNQLQ